MNKLTIVIRADEATDQILVFSPCTPRKEVFKWLAGALRNYKCTASKGKGESRGLQPTYDVSPDVDVLPVQRVIKRTADAAPMNESRMTPYTRQFGYVWDRTPVGGSVGSSVENIDGGITSERHGIENPAWRQQVKSGTNATTPFSGSRETVELVAGEAKLEWWFEGSNGYCSDMRVGHLAAPWISVMRDAELVSRAEAGALKKLHKFILSTQQSADVGESLAEYSQAIRMIGRPLAGMRDLLERTERRVAYNARFAQYVSEAKSRRAMERRIEKYRLDNPQEKEAAIAAGKLYLEWKFGMEPLIRDLADVLAEVYESRLRKLQKSKRFSFRVDSNPVSTTTVVPDVNYLRFDRTETETHYATVRFIVGFKIDSSVAAEQIGILSRIGISPKRFIPTAYAVIPYSWLFDYFTAVNDVIDALFADLSAVAWCCRTDRYESIHTDVEKLNEAETLAAIGTENAKVSASTVFRSSLKRVHVERSIPTDFVPDAQLSVKALGNPERLKILTALILSKVKYPSIFKGKF